MTAGRFRVGNAATVTSVALVPILGFAALAIDVGMLRVAEAELQGAVDAGALGGAGYLDGTERGLRTALLEARRMTEQNTVAGERPRLGPSDVVPGVYDLETGSFVESWDAQGVNAIRVDVDITDVPAFFAPAAFGVRFTSTRKVATATRPDDAGSGRQSCWLPLAIPDCYFTDLSPDQAEGMSLQLGSARNDNVGWASVDGHPSASDIATHLDADACVTGTAMVGDPAYLNNGVLGGELSHLREQLGAPGAASWDQKRWGPPPAPMHGSTHPRYGNVVEGAIILFATSDTTAPCGSAEQFTQDKPITGFAWAVIYDVDDKGSDQNMRVKLDFTNPYPTGESSGGLRTNVTYPYRGGLVR